MSAQWQRWGLSVSVSFSLSLTDEIHDSSRRHCSGSTENEDLMEIDSHVLFDFTMISPVWLAAFPLAAQWEVRTSPSPSPLPPQHPSLTILTSSFSPALRCLTLFDGFADSFSYVAFSSVGVRSLGHHAPLSFPPFAPS